MAFFSSKRKVKAAPLPALPASAPKHVAIIMDGNGRWAQSRGMPRLAGHKKGADALRNILHGCPQLGIECLTVYAFSSENWKRPHDEVSDLMGLLRVYLQSEVASLHSNGVKLKIIGDRSRLDADILSGIHAAETLTKNNTAFQLNVALSYGSRQEIVHAAQQMARQVAEGKISVDAITEEAISAELYTTNSPELDLLIRTGGEQRLSNFLLWQSAYTEFYFTPVLWPDFKLEHLREAIMEFSNRERRYGTTSA